MSDIVETLLRGVRVIPVLTIPEVDDAVPLARALAAGGIRTLEVTLRTDCALEAALRIHNEVPECVVGLGTVLTPTDLTRVRSAGLRFAFSPGATPALLNAARELDIAFVPGVQTASELMQSLEHGFSVVKFFPAQPAGGLAALRALAGPFPNARFCPTGGLDEASVTTWLAEPNVLAIGGSWLAPVSDIATRAWERITARARHISGCVAVHSSNA